MVRPLAASFPTATAVPSDRAGKRPPPLQRPEFGFYEGRFVGESLLLMTPSALHPAVIARKPRSAR
jgi:hypothetical protein